VLGVFRNSLGQHLDRNIAFEPLVASSVHHTHSTGTDLLDDAVVPEYLVNQL